MVSQPSLLVMLVDLVEAIPCPAPIRGRGRPPAYPDRLFLKALVVMLVRGVPTVGGLLAILEQPTPERRALRARLSERGRFPSRRTWERRLAALPATLPAHIGHLGAHPVGLLRPWRDCGRAVAIDSTALRARGGVWHRRDRQAGVVPHTSIGTEAGRTHSGWHGRVYGRQLHLATTVAAAWIPLAAELTPADVADSRPAPRLLDRLPPGARSVLADSSSNDPGLRRRCAAAGRCLVASRRRPHPRTDDGAAVRRVFYLLRHRAIENFHGQFKGIFGLAGPVPTRGLRRTQRWALGAVFVYQLTLLHRFERGSDLRVGLKAFLKAA